jgi:hypothetical protein
MGLRIRDNCGGAVSDMGQWFGVYNDQETLDQE